MFSASLEIVLTIAYREAVSRRHAYLTLEHLLYALAHDPDGERILGACGADLPRLRRDLDAYLDESIEQLAPRPGARARTDGGVPPRAADRGAARAERAAAGSAGRRHLRGDPPAAEDARGPAARRAGHHAARRARIHLARHHARRPIGGPSDHGEPAPAPPAAARRGPGHRARSAVRLLPEPDRARAAGPARSAHRPRRRAAAHDRSALPAPQEQSGVRRRRRRRQDGDGRRPGHAAAGRRRARAR